MNDAEKQLKEAKGLLLEALNFMAHSFDCEQAVFCRHNRSIPPSHPVWAHSPACSCIVGRIQKFTNNN